MTIEETTAMVILYRACQMAKMKVDLRDAMRMAKRYVPALATFDGPAAPAGGPKAVRTKFPFRSHRTQAEVFRDEQQGV